MKIISDFPDFYDITLGYGSESDIRYIRKREEVKLAEKYPRLERISIGFDKFVIRQYIVGFCGKTYPVLFLSQLDEKRKDYYCKDTTLDKIAECRRTQLKSKLPIRGEFIHSLTELDTWVDANFKKDQIKDYYHRAKARRWWYNPKSGREQFEEYFEAISNWKTQIWETHSVPVWLIDEANIIVHHDPRPAYAHRIVEYEFKPLILNPCLKNCEFQRVIEPYTAFQEITMRVTNTARPEPHVPVPSDKDMVEIKGFDKYSFRKPKQEKK